MFTPAIQQCAYALQRGISTTSSLTGTQTQNLAECNIRFMRVVYIRSLWAFYNIVFATFRNVYRQQLCVHASGSLHHVHILFQRTNSITPTTSMSNPACISHQLQRKSHWCPPRRSVSVQPAYVHDAPSLAPSLSTSAYNWFVI